MIPKNSSCRAMAGFKVCRSKIIEVNLAWSGQYLATGVHFNNSLFISSFMRAMFFRFMCGGFINFPLAGPHMEVGGHQPVLNRYLEKE